MSRLTTIFLLTSLIFVSGLVRAGEFQVSSSGSKVVYKTATDDFKAPSGRSWSQIINFGEYESTQSLSGKVRHTPSGAVSAQSISGGVKLSVARQTVLKNLLTKAVAGGRIAAGIGSGPVGWALTAATAYEVISPFLAKEGFTYDSDLGNFVKKTPSGGWCVSALNAPPRCSDYRIKAGLDYWQKSDYDNQGVQDALCKVAYMRGYRFNPVPEGAESFRAINGWCHAYKRRYDGRWDTYQLFATIDYFNYKDASEPITQQQFDAIIGPKADANPSQYVNLTAKDDGNVPDVTVSDKVTVPNGTVLTIGPYTDSDGQPKQVTVTFITKNGETTVSVNTTPRPDLTPNSPSAPSASPNTGGQSSPSGSPNSSGQSSSQTNTQTGSQTSPQTGGQTGNQSNPKQDGEPDKKDEDKPKDGSFLCDLFPDILACDKQPEPEEPDLQIPEQNINLNFTPDTTFAENGQCPAPVTFEALGSTYAISLQPACDLAALMRPFIIAMAWLVASFFVVRVVRENA